MYKLHILETSDIHGYIFPTSYATKQYSNIGIAKVSSLVQEIRRSNENVLLIDNGDTIQGSPLSYYHAVFQTHTPNPMALAMNHLKYDAVSLGNHDFNYGFEYLSQFIKELNAPIINCNILKDGSKLFSPYIIKQLNDGPKIAIIGAVTQYIPNWEQPNNILGLSFQNAYESIKNTVEEIRKDVDLIVVSYHGGFEKSLETGVPTELQTGENLGYQILTNIPGIDVLLTGHQHRSIHINNIHNTAVLQPTHQGIEVGYAIISFEQKDGNWIVINKETSLLKTDAIPEDSSIINQIESFETDVQSWLDSPIGTLDKPMIVEDPFLSRLYKHDIVQFINDVQLEASKADISCNALGNSVVGFNKNITMRDIISTYIYPNTLVVLEVTGEQLKKILEFNAKYWVLNNGKIEVNPWYTNPKPQHYNYDMFDGISYTIKVSNTENVIMDLNKDGKPVHSDDIFTLVVNNYRASGGGDFPVYKDLKVIKEIQTDMIELIANYILKYDGTISIKNKNNITITT